MCLRGNKEGTSLCQQVPRSNVRFEKERGFIDYYDYKEFLRRCLLRRRKSLSPLFVQKKSKVIVNHLLENPITFFARRVAFYYPIDNEVNLLDLARIFLEKGKVVLFPRSKEDTLEFFEVRSLSDMRSGRFGIPEPIPQSLPVSLKEIDLFFVPGVAFGIEGSRIGYGKGFYDRVLCRVERMKRVGVCYDFQLLSVIPYEDHDMKMGSIVTESGIINCKMRRLDIR